MDMDMGSMIFFSDYTDSPLQYVQGVDSDTLTYESLSLVINLAYKKKNCWNPIDPSVIYLG